jgi:hypothetical protein
MHGPLLVMSNVVKEGKQSSRPIPRIRLHILPHDGIVPFLPQRLLGICNLSPSSPKGLNRR